MRYVSIMVLDSLHVEDVDTRAYPYDVWVVEDAINHSVIRHPDVLRWESHEVELDRVLENVRPVCSICVVISRFSTTFAKYIDNSHVESIECDFTEFVPSDHFIRHEFVKRKRYIRHPSSEMLYLQLLNHVLQNGEQRIDRTGVGTLSTFGPQIEFNLQEGFPLLTTKRLNFVHILHEVMWYISGSMDTKYLREHGVNVWNGNTTREFLDARGLSDYPVGHTGPIYGYQWRHFGGNEHQPGVDQLARLLSILRTDPTSRRMYMSAWNPCDLDKMCLEPCHVSFQLYVREEKYLDGKLYLRSNDLFLGAPWNISAYSILLFMFCHLSGYTPGRLVYTIGDAHIYQNHIKQVQTQLQRVPRTWPHLSICDEQKSIRNWEDFRVEHFHLHSYQPQSAIRADMAV